MATIRPVTQVDAGEWVRMRACLWPEGADHADEVAVFFRSNTFPWAGSLLSWKVLVAERVGQGLCGFVETSIRPHVDGCSTSPVGYVEGWYVDPDARRQGIGTKLVEAAELWAAAEGCREMASDAHLSNAVSHAAHRALGFLEHQRLVHFRKVLSGTPGKPAAGSFVMFPLWLRMVAGSFAVCKLASDAPIPLWATTRQPFTITRTADELSVACREEMPPPGTVCERGWRCLRVVGAMPFTQVGVLASLTVPLAKAGIGIFAFSTFDTDYLLIKADDYPKALAALRAAGHGFEA